MADEAASGQAAAVEEAPKKLPPLDPETMRVTRLYEMCLLFDPAEATRTWEKLAEWIRDLLTTKYGAHVYRVDKWADSRRLSYEINGLKRATYMLAWFRAKPAVIAELDREIRLDERCARHLIVVHEEEPPTVGMSAEDFEAAVRVEERRDDRGFGGFDRGFDRGDRGFDRDRGGGGFDRGDRGFDRERGGGGFERGGFDRERSGGFDRGGDRERRR